MFHIELLLCFNYTPKASKNKKTNREVSYIESMETEDGKLVSGTGIGGKAVFERLVKQNVRDKLKSVFGKKTAEALFEEWYEMCEETEDKWADTNKEGYLELRGEVPYNSGHLQSAIVVRTNGEKTPLGHEIVFSNKLWEDNESRPLTHLKIYTNGDGDPVRSADGKMYLKPVGYDWTPEVKKYDYRYNDEVKAPDGSIYDEIYVEEYMDSLYKRKGLK